MDLDDLGRVCYHVPMGTEDDALVIFLKELMRQRGLLPSQLASDLDVNHATVSRWLSREDAPNLQSCQKLASYAHVSLEAVVRLVAGLPAPPNQDQAEWPAFREYAKRKYPAELSDDLITMIEALIEYRRRRKEEE